MTNPEAHIVTTEHYPLADGHEVRVRRVTPSCFRVTLTLPGSGWTVDRALPLWYPRAIRIDRALPLWDRTFSDDLSDLWGESARDFTRRYVDYIASLHGGFRVDVAANQPCTPPPAANFTE